MSMEPAINEVHEKKFTFSLTHDEMKMLIVAGLQMNGKLKGMRSSRVYETCVTFREDGYLCIVEDISQLEMKT